MGTKLNFMTREELLELVNEKVDTTKFKSLSKKSIEEEVDDALEDISEDEEANDKIVAKLANRLKRMDGNLHKNVSDEMKKNKEAEDTRKRQEEEKTKKEKESKEKDSIEEKFADLLKEFEALKTERKKAEEKRAKDALLQSVKDGLKDKFEKAGLKLNGFFAKSALSRLQIPEDSTDVDSLIAEAEKLYNADVKEAGFFPESKPRTGGKLGEKAEDEHEFDDIKSMAARNKPKAEDQN